MNTIAVIDYGMGNLHSVSKALIKVSPSDQILVTSKKSEIENKLKIKITKPIILFTQHPIPMENEKIQNNFEKILHSIKKLKLD